MPQERQDGGYSPTTLLKNGQKRRSHLPKGRSPAGRFGLKTGELLGASEASATNREEGVFRLREIVAATLGISPAEFLERQGKNDPLVLETLKRFKEG